MAHANLGGYKFDSRIYRNTQVHYQDNHQFVQDQLEDPAERKDFKCFNCGRKNACVKQTCPHKTHEDGSHTSREYKRMMVLKAATKQDSEDGDNHLQTEEKEVSFEDQIDNDDNYTNIFTIQQGFILLGQHRNPTKKTNIEIGTKTGTGINVS